MWPWVKSRTPSENPIPTKIGSKMGGAPTPNGTIGFDPQPCVFFEGALLRLKKGRPKGTFLLGGGPLLFPHAFEHLTLALNW